MINAKKVSYINFYALQKVSELLKLQDIRDEQTGFDQNL